MFLASDSEGNASLKRFDEQPRNVQTWFSFLPFLVDLRICRKVETHIFGQGNNNDSIEFTASYCQTSEVEAC